MRRLSKKQHNSPARTDRRFFFERECALKHEDMPRYRRLYKHFAGGPVLEIGCGNTPIFAELEGDIHAVDFAPGLIKVMQSRFPHVSFKKARAETLPYDDREFTYVVLGELLEHVDDPSAVIAEARRVLQPRGWIALSVPHDEQGKNPALDRTEHVWSFTLKDVEELLGAPAEVELYREGYETILAWKQI